MNVWLCINVIGAALLAISLQGCVVAPTSIPEKASQVIQPSRSQIPDRQGPTASLNGEQLAHQLRNNVVKLDVRWSTRNDQTLADTSGFGFIVAEEQGKIIIVTANHVVRPKAIADDPDATATISVVYHEHQTEKYPATLLESYQSQRDIAVIKAERPEGLSWRSDVLWLDHPERPEEIWFIGREDRPEIWYIPSKPGTVNRIDWEDRIWIDALSVRPGSSGAPVLTAKGIVGMIISDYAGDTRALSIDRIRGYVAEEWRYPWALTTLTKPHGAIAVASEPDDTKQADDLAKVQQPRDFAWVQLKSEALLEAVSARDADAIAMLAAPPFFLHGETLTNRDQIRETYRGRMHREGFPRQAMIISIDPKSVGDYSPMERAPELDEAIRASRLKADDVILRLKLKLEFQQVVDVIHLYRKWGADWRLAGVCCVETSPQVWIGLRIEDLSVEQAHALGLKHTLGAFVAEVVPGSPAEQAGIRQDDVILELAGNRVTNGKRFIQLVQRVEVGESIPITLWRESRKVFVSARIEAFTIEEPAPPRHYPVPTTEIRPAHEPEQLHLPFGGAWINPNPDLAGLHRLAIEQHSPHELSAITASGPCYDGTPPSGCGWGNGQGHVDGNQASAVLIHDIWVVHNLQLWLEGDRLRVHVISRFRDHTRQWEGIMLRQ